MSTPPLRQQSGRAIVSRAGSKPWCMVVFDTLCMASQLVEGVGGALYLTPAFVWSSMPCHEHDQWFAPAPAWVQKRTPGVRGSDA